MTPAELIIDAFGRTRAGGLAVVRGLTDEQLAHLPAPGANSIAWLVWHLTRVQDDHIADASGIEQVWTAQGFAPRFDLPLPLEDTGFGHTADQVASVHADADLLADYLAAVYEQTVTWVENLTESDLERVVDTRWDPPVTLGVRLVSVIDDDAQHLGQAAYLRGLIT